MRVSLWLVSCLSSFRLTEADYLVETRWGLGLDSHYFPKENVVPYSKVSWVMHVCLQSVYSLPLDSVRWRPDVYARPARIQGLAAVVVPSCRRVCESV